jgi:hypothetical protein
MTGSQHTYEVRPRKSRGFPSSITPSQRNPAQNEQDRNFIRQNVKDVVAKNDENRYSKLEKRKTTGSRRGVDGCVVDLDKIVVPWPNEI